MPHPFACYHTAANDIPIDFTDIMQDHIYMIERQRPAFQRHAKTADIRRLVYHICHNIDHPDYKNKHPQRRDWCQVVDEAALLESPYRKSHHIDDESSGEPRSFQAKFGSQRSGGQRNAIYYYDGIPDPNPELGTFYGLFTDPMGHPVFQAKATALPKLQLCLDKWGCV